MREEGQALVPTMEYRLHVLASLSFDVAALSNTVGKSSFSSFIRSFLRSFMVAHGDFIV